MEFSSQDKIFLLNSIRNVPNFPKEGIIFKDITTLLNHPIAFNLLLSGLETRYRSMNIDYIAGIESRGFIFGAALATRLGIGFVPVRKKGKLPSTTIGEKYTLEYGVDEIQIHLDAFSAKENPRVVLVDDLIATGGTAVAATNLINKAGATLIEACFVIELSFLEGKNKLSSLTPVYSVLQVND